MKKHIHMRSGASALLALLALAAPAAAPAGAAPASSRPAAFALSPVDGSGSLVLRGAPSETLRGAVSVRNLSRHAITVLLQPADIRNAGNGNADYVTDRLDRAGRWLRLATKVVALAPRDVRRVPFTVHIPAGTRGASHYAGFVATDSDELRAANAPGSRRRRFTFYRVNRQALPLTVRGPGPLSRSLRLRSVALAVRPADAALELGLLPSGTVLLGSARVKLRVQRAGKTLFTHAANLGQLFPATVLTYKIPWRGRLTPGAYRVRGVVRPLGAAAVPIDKTVTFTPAKQAALERATPHTAHASRGLPAWVWLALGGAALLLTVLLAAVWRLRRAARAEVPLRSGVGQR